MSDAVTTEPETGGWTKRKLRIALLCSLAVNLLGLGLIVGAMLAGPHHHSRGEFGLKGFAATLPNERGEALRQSFKEHRPKFRELREAARAARRDATGVLVADPYDQAKMRASLQRVDDAESQLRTNVSDFFIEATGKLTLAERQQLAEWWTKRQPHLFWRRSDSKTEGETTSGSDNK